VFELVQGMQQRGVPIDGVGLQLHIDISYSMVSGVVANMKRLGALGLKVTAAQFAGHWEVC
jgi:endo-1,4-beta-xylanase